eukprot:CAMPEP_0197580518 /NCGR_PEP_ID=MMETSP1326-20131121/4292_1 /TAXON_ID=1155430 /ORGANISM="Genus nov. species nov., Strain RCC2288" /LENGTH=71 /DNA_ID=CAMNT_0043144281 /DNA_START=1242 /DNA_END=1454 /DNA_ORIENTATION=+
MASVWCNEADKAALTASGITEAAVAILCSRHENLVDRRSLAAGDADAIAEIASSVDASFMLFSAYLVFFMQ